VQAAEIPTTDDVPLFHLIPS